MGIAGEPTADLSAKMIELFFVDSVLFGQLTKGGKAYVDLDSKSGEVTVKTKKPRKSKTAKSQKKPEAGRDSSGNGGKTEAGQGDGSDGVKTKASQDDGGNGEKAEAGLGDGSSEDPADPKET